MNRVRIIPTKKYHTRPEELFMMNITPFERNFNVFDPFADFDRFYDGRQMPSIKTDIKDNGDAFELSAELPGFNKEDISIDIDKDRLVISAEHSENKDEKDENGKYIRRERSYGSFTRSFDISAVNASAISAKYENGVLTLNLPKKTPEQEGARRLQIQ